jgi:quercetin dioxygenase-like cupin family protein
MRIAIEPPPGGGAFRFHGVEHGGVGVSFFVNRTLPGRRVSLHTHPYPEVFLLEEGDVTFRVGDEVVVSHGGEVVVVPAGTPHGFENTGTEPLKMTSIHPVAEMVTEWVEEEA